MRRAEVWLTTLTRCYPTPGLMKCLVSLEAKNAALHIAA